MRILVAFSLSCLLGACGDLTVRSVRPPQVVPAELVGEWAGTWQATGAASNGNIVVRVQEFGGAPVVHVEFTNPCIEPRAYDLVVTAATFELRADGQTVLAATLGEGRQLVGIYQCTSESGTWMATWQHDLPSLVDLGGTWSGSLVVAGQPERQVDLVLSQSVSGGELRLQGLFDLGEAWPLLVPLDGAVFFRENGYDVVLRTIAGHQPSLLLTGIGDLEPLRIENGLLQTIGSQVLPFQNAVFTIVRQVQ